MTLSRLTTLPALCALFSACTTAEPPSPGGAVRHDGAKSQQPQLEFQLASGVYHCEFGQKVEIQRETSRTNSIDLNWQGNRHTLLRYDSTSGQPRYEDRQNGLLWIDLPWKSVLMDINTGRPLATDCKATNASRRGTQPDPFYG